MKSRPGPAGASAGAPLTDPSNDRLGWGELLAYGSGDLGMSVAWSVLGAFTTFFLTDSVGLSPAVAGLIVLISRVFDGVSDVVVGTMVDRTRSKLGQARPWLLRMAIPTGIAYVLFFSAPDLADWGKILWVFVTYNLMSTVCYTAVNIPYAALSPLMTRHAASRVNLNVIRMLCAALSGVVASAATMPLVNALGGGPGAWRIVSGGYAVFMVAAILVCGWKTRERHAIDPSTPAGASTPPTWTAVKGVLTNKYWGILTACLMVYFLLQNIGNGVTVYYFKYIIGDENAMGLAAVAMALPMLVGLAVMPFLARRISKGALARASAVAGMAAPLILLLDPYSLPLLLAKSALTGLAMVPFAAVGFAMLADVCDYGRWKTGIRSEGLINSAASLGIKVGTGLGMATLGWVLTLGHYDAEAAVQPPSALAAMVFCQIWLPVILCGVQLLLLCFYRLDRDYPAILAQLTSREQESGKP
ncbi:MAG: glycoside-pentoside-hexuronide (GPH):cation symporter [Propionibacteriaceae bacterium]|jgi:GPH family glycoside/pentoside/hexuronide:cation symporter|nr:glycoside-pentoside-hexuronide (GPH):cation symporter [Propionibacteriaceae bacterium]